MVIVIYTAMYFIIVVLPLESSNLALVKVTGQKNVLGMASVEINRHLRNINDTRLILPIY